MDIKNSEKEPVINVCAVPCGSVIEFINYKDQYVYTLLVTQFKEEDKFVRCVDVRDGEIIDVPWNIMVTCYTEAELYLGK